MNEDVHLKLLIPCVAAGAIIGKGGEALEKIKRQTGARLKMSKANDFYPGTTERVCVIMGTIQACMQLSDYIMRKVSERPELIPSDGSPVSSHERHNQVKILVPNTTAGIIIGKSGSFIKCIKEKSGAAVQISQRCRELRPVERCIVITGDLEERRAAVSMVLSKIAEDPHSGSCPNCSYAHVSVHGAFTPSQPMPPPPYSTSSTTLNKTINDVEIRSHACANTTPSFDPYTIGPNTGKEHVPMYHDSSALPPSAMPPIFFGFPPQDVTNLSPSTFSMFPSPAYPDFTQVVFNTPSRHMVHSSPLLNPTGNFLGPPAAVTSFGVPSGLVPPAPMCRTKFIPVGSASEASRSVTWLPPVQRTAFNSVRFSPLVAEPFADAASSLVLVNDRTTVSLANAIHLIPNYGLRCEARHLAYPQNAMSEAVLLRPSIESFPQNSDPERLNNLNTTSNPAILIPTSNLGEYRRPDDKAELLAATTTTEPETTAHTRYCSGESTDSALTASLTSLRLHPSLDDHPSTEDTHCSSPKSESQPTQQSLESITSNGTLLRVNQDPPGQLFNPNIDFPMVEYPYMIPQNPLYGTGRILNSSVMPPFPGTVVINQALSNSVKVSTNMNSSGFHAIPCTTTATSDFAADPNLYSLIPNRPVNTQPPPRVLQYRYTTSPPTSFVPTSAIGSYSQPHAFNVPQNECLAAHTEFQASWPTALVEGDPATGSGLLLVGTLQQVQHALATLHMYTGPVIAPQSAMRMSEPSGPALSSSGCSSPKTTTVTTTSFTLDSPLRVDRIQPLSLPIVLQAFSRPVHSLSEPMPSTL